MTDRRSGQQRRVQDAMLDRRVARVDMIARLMLAGDAIYIVLAAKTSPDSVPQLMLELDWFGGVTVIGAICTCAFLILADVVVNDWLPARFVFRWARNNRRWIYFATAWLCMLPAFSATTVGLTRPSSTFLYLSMAAAGIAMGFRDALSIRRSRAQCAT